MLPLNLYFGLMENPQSPEGGEQEGKTETKCLVLCGSRELPCMARAQNVDFGGQENREEDAHADAEGSGGRQGAQEESWWRGTLSWKSGSSN